MPRVFTATQTNGQSTLLTQDVQGKIDGALPGSIVNAYLAYWADAATPAFTTASIISGKITNSGDKVATDLAIEFLGGIGTFDPLPVRIATELNKVAPASPAKPGIADAVPAGVASLIPVYVKLVRSNDVASTAAQSGTQNYLNARAILGTTLAAVAAATPAGSLRNRRPDRSCLRGHAEPDHRRHHRPSDRERRDQAH